MAGQQSSTGRGASAFGEGDAALSYDDVVALDRELVRLCRFNQRGRLRVGQALVAVDRSGGHQELGFSTFSAYARERCSKSGKWAGQVRTMAKRLERLPHLRTTLLRGELPWSTVELLARHATPETDLESVALGREKTVRQLRAHFRQDKEKEADKEGEATTDASEAGGATGAKASAAEAVTEAMRTGAVGAYADRKAPQEEDTREDSAGASFVDLTAFFDPDRAADPDAPTDTDEPVRTLTLRLPVEEAWALEATRMLVEYLEGPARQGRWLEPLLIEAQDLLRERSGDALTTPGLAERFRNLPELRRKIQQARDEAEAKAEPWLEPHWDPSLLQDWPLGPAPFEDDDAPPVHRGLQALDKYIQQTCRDLASRDLLLGRVLHLFWSARGWLDLGYASDTQYARERLGLSRASVKTRITLARRTAPLCEVGHALQDGHLGFEAASLIARVATPQTAQAWLERAQERTYKHLREEVQAVQLLRRLSPEPEAPYPPDEAVRQEIEDLERAVMSGQLWRIARERAEAPDAPVQMSARSATDADTRHASHGESQRGPAEAMVTLRLVVPEELALQYRQLEAAFRRSGLPGSFAMFLCTNFASIWADTLGTSDQWEAIYRRDRYRCSSPVCFRRDCTLHHIQYRSRGGGDDPENLTSPCAFCHLEGEHGGRLKILPPGSSPTWILGRTPILVVEGREKRAVA